MSEDKFDGDCKIENSQTKKKKLDIFSMTVSAQYFQDADSNSNEKESIHELKLSTSDAGGGIYYVLSCSRWAFDNIDDLIDILKDFAERVNDIQDDGYKKLEDYDHE